MPVHKECMPEVSPDPEVKPIKLVTGSSGTEYSTWTKMKDDGDTIDVLDYQGAPPEDLAHGG